MSYALSVNEYGCYDEQIMEILDPYITSYCQNKSMFLDIMLYCPGENVGIYKDILDFSVEAAGEVRNERHTVYQMSIENVILSFESTPYGIYVTVLIRSKESVYDEPKFFVPTLIVISN